MTGPYSSSVPVTIAVLTMTRGQHEHLLGQVDGLSVGSIPPDLHVVISMGDRDLTRGRLPLGTDRWRTIVKPVPTDRRALPYAAARNLAASLAVEAGADVLVFLDAAVIPGPRLLERYAEVVTQGGQGTGEGPVLWTGAVLDLPTLQNGAVGYPLRKLHEMARRAPGAPPLSAGQTRAEQRWHLFSPANFAMSAADFERSGGFVEAYTGPGLEAADLATTVEQQGGSFVWVGGAEGYRQPGEPLSPELEVRYALAHRKIWQERWGTEPGHPWLTRLIGEGLLVRARDGSLTARGR